MKNTKINSDKIEELTREFLIALGDNPEREGLVKTPKRVARMCKELFEGMTYTNEDIAMMYKKDFYVGGRAI